MQSPYKSPYRKYVNAVLTYFATVVIVATGVWLFVSHRRTLESDSGTSTVLRKSSIRKQNTGLPRISTDDRDVQTPPGVLAKKAFEILEKHCYDCHGLKDNEFHALDRHSMVASRNEVNRTLDPYINPGEPRRSRIWQVVEAKFMPPEDRPQLSHEEKLTLKKWIQDGAIFPVLQKNEEVISPKIVLKSIREHLINTPEDDRPFFRYLALAHMWNNPTVTEKAVRLCRAAVVKLLNSLSDQREIYHPVFIDEKQTVVAVDLRQFGQDDRVWLRLEATYPYNYRYRDKSLAENRQTSLTKLQDDIEDLRADSLGNLPFLRADWFVATASQPPWYLEMLSFLRNAKTLSDLERVLGVDVAENFRNGNLVRAGFAKSGVAIHSRVIERQDSRIGAYWKSYDFLSGAGKRNPMRFPLGPQSMSQNELNSFYSFTHDANEMIFEMPNGFHGYMITNDLSNSIPIAEVSIVRDTRESAGTPAIVTGLSCMGCHRMGLRTFQDTVRSNADVANLLSQEEIEKIYIAHAEMSKIVTLDNERYRSALLAAIGTYLKQGKDADREITDFAEPISFIARDYYRDLNIQRAASELGIDVDKLRSDLDSTALRKLGLVPLTLQDGQIERTAWEFVYLEAIRAENLGIPLPPSSRQ